MVLRLSCARLFVTLWTAAYQASLSFTIYWSLLKLMSIERVMPMLLSIRPTLSFPACVHESVLYICFSTPALQIGSSVPFF